MGEILHDLPDADIAPPDSDLFIANMNPATQDGDLELIFSRFGPIKSCEIVRDWKTGDSLQYAFITFENQRDCEEAYFKMHDCVIDDRRIVVNFSQSVAKLWNKHRTGARIGKEDIKEADKGKGKRKGKGKNDVPLLAANEGPKPGARGSRAVDMAKRSRSRDRKRRADEDREKRIQDAIKGAETAARHG